jgi:hypothetical protein
MRLLRPYAIGERLAAPEIVGLDRGNKRAVDHDRPLMFAYRGTRTRRLGATTVDAISCRDPRADYRRPNLLRRALASLATQTHRDWRCVVIDDDPGSVPTRDLCNSQGDSRIIYQSNPRNLGIGANVDKAFSLPPLPGATHICVLEDDNYYLPDCLAANLETCERSGVDVVMRNSLIETPSRSIAHSAIGSRTLFEGQYVDGVATREELWSTLFYSVGATNVGLFWRARSGLNFSTVSITKDPLFQERLRTLCIDRPVYIAMTPQIVWRDNGAESTRPSSTGLGRRLDQVRGAARERKLYQMLYAHLQEQGHEEKILHSRLRSYDVHCERVFRRVGIEPRVPALLSTNDRVKLRLKRTVAEVASLAIAEQVDFSLDGGRTKPCQPRGRG